MLAELLDEAFEVLRRESPEHLGLLRDALGGRVVALVVDGERMLSDGDSLGTAAASAALTVGTDARTVLALLDDRLTLLDAVRSGALRARGHRSAIAAAEAAMRAFLHGLVRCPSAPGLLVQLRHLVAERETDHGQES